MRKILAWVTWLSLSAVSPIALAVGLGQASVSSYLNAPLNASIPLLESGDYTLDAIRVSVAEPADFVAAGLEWTPLAASVRALIQEQQGQRQVHLSSEHEMEEPWLELLLTIEYPEGQQARDVTLLFDPQGYAAAPQTAEASPPTLPRDSASGDNNSSGNRGNTAYVNSGDTLWGVAERIKPTQASVQQMMVALLETNPEIFPSGNIHDMRAGQTLRIPDIERTLARSHRDADTTIKTMNEAWRARRTGSLPAQPLPVAKTAPAPETATVSEASIAATQAVQAGVMAEQGTLVLTRAELTEQLRLSQAMHQQVLDERESMRSELNELRGEVATLTQALDDALAAQEPAPTPLAANVERGWDSGGQVLENQNLEDQGLKEQNLGALVARYQWPLALTAIALLMALLVWLRKRREETWQDVPLAEPVIKPSVSPNTAPTADSASREVESVEQSHADEGNPEKADDSVLASSIAPIAAPPVNPGQWQANDHERALHESGTFRYEKSQASGLAEQERQRRSGVSLAPPLSPVAVKLMLGSLGADPVSASTSATAYVPHSEEPHEAPGDAGHSFIDYHPPVVLSSAVSRGDEPRSETLMQPTVEFVTESPPALVKTTPRPIEEEWEIEEVAFTPRGLDNSEPSKSST